MNNFKRIASQLDVSAVLAALEAQPELWKQITLRQGYPGSAHHDTEAIFLRGPAAFSYEEYMGNASAHDYPALDALSPAIGDLLRPVLQALEVTELGYVLIVALAPYGAVDEHIDEGAYGDHYTRFHIALTGDSGATLTAGDETQHFAPGECWWFNHKLPHSAVNNSPTPRIHIIFDAVTPNHRVHIPA